MSSEEEEEHVNSAFTSTAGFSVHDCVQTSLSRFKKNELIHVILDGIFGCWDS